MTQHDEDTMLATVTGLIMEVVGDELELAEPITLQTSFNKDLELESIEFVALAEQLQSHYGEKVNFVDWLSNKELDEIIALTVGDLVEFIKQCQS